MTVDHTLAPIRAALGAEYDADVDRLASLAGAMRANLHTHYGALAMVASSLDVGHGAAATMRAIDDLKAARNERDDLREYLRDLERVVSPDFPPSRERLLGMVKAAAQALRDKERAEALRPAAGHKTTTALQAGHQRADGRLVYHVPGHMYALVPHDEDLGVAAWGWGGHDFTSDLGDFASVQAALEALNAHPPTVERWGRLVLPAAPPDVRTLVAQPDGDYAVVDNADSDDVCIQRQQTQDGIYYYTAYGWDGEDFLIDLGDFPRARDAVAALNFHPPTAACWGRLVLPPEADAPATTALVKKVRYGDVVYDAEGHDKDTVIVCRGGTRYDAWGWDADKGWFQEALGGFPSLDAALAALNDHAPTRQRWGRLVLPAEG